MSVSMIAYGRLEDGNYGILLDNNGKPLVAVVEVFDSLPDANLSENYEGRVVHDTSSGGLYYYSKGEWHSIGTFSVEFGEVFGNPPVDPDTPKGSLFVDTGTGQLFVWDGTTWINTSAQAATANIVGTTYYGDGVTTSFALSTSPTDPDFVEVFLDGVRQEPSVDYFVIAGQLVMATPPANGLKLIVREYSSIIPPLNANTEMFSFGFYGDGVTSTFPIGTANAPKNAVMVFKNGLILREGIDYTLSTVSTDIVSLTKIDETTARVQTLNPHRIPLNSNIALSGFIEDQWNDTFTVKNIVSVTSFDIQIDGTYPNTGTVTPDTRYFPNYTPDDLTFTVTPSGTDYIILKVFRNVSIREESFTNITDASIVGYSVISNPNPPIPTFKRIDAGTGVSITDSGTELTIAVDNHLYLYRTPVSVAAYTTNDTDVYIGSTASSLFPSTITIGTTPLPGRRLIIKDEGGFAGTNPITIAGATIDGVVGGTINTNYGSITLVSDGANWFTI